MLEWLDAAFRDVVHISTALGGRRGLDRAQQLRPDLIVLSEQLPDLDAATVLAELKRSPGTREIPVILAAPPTEDDAQEAVWLRRGAADYLHKPYRLAELETRITTHLRARQLEHQVQLHTQVIDERVQERTRALEAEIRQRREAEQRFAHHLYHDQVTGLPNRMLLQEQLQARTAQAQSEPFALAILVLRGFHEINHVLGYEVGSQLLHEVALRLDTAAGTLAAAMPIERRDGQTHYVASLSGVSFALLLRAGEDAESVGRAMQALLGVLDRSFEFDGIALTVGAHAGVVRCPADAEEPGLLLRNAHIAVEEAIVNDQRVTFYHDGINRYSARRLSLMSELKAAIEKDTLELAFQPQLHLRHGRIASVEALLRWQHPELGFVRPDEFIPLAEQGGAIKSLTSWVLRAAVRQCRAFMDLSLPLGVSVNLSARNLHEPDLAQQIMDLLRRYDVPPERLLLEVTETAVMKGPDAAMRALGDLNGEGVRSSIDDFGTGYSSLGYLRNLPVSEVKIDRTFVMEMQHNKDDRVIVQTIIDMGHNLGLQVVAEGVEEAYGLTALNDMGCDYAQGYYIARPMFGKNLIEWLAHAPYPVVAPENILVC